MDRMESQKLTQRRAAQQPDRPVHEPTAPAIAHAAAAAAQMGPIGIVAALPQELTELLVALRADPAMRLHEAGRRSYYSGMLWGTPCVLTLARIGKVAAATTTTALLHQFDVAGIVFTGVAGATAAQVRVGDIVLAQSLMQHDMDASPLFPPQQVPLLGLDRFSTDAALSAQLADAAADFLRDDWPGLQRSSTGLHGPHEPNEPNEPRLHRGLILSGDRFIAERSAVAALLQIAPDALAVEMEGAAAAQVCHEYGVPYAMFRSISDSADAAAPGAFAEFLEAVASRYSYGVLKRFLAAEAQRRSVVARQAAAQ